MNSLLRQFIPFVFRAGVFIAAAGALPVVFGQDGEGSPQRFAAKLPDDTSWSYSLQTPRGNPGSQVAAQSTGGAPGHLKKVEISRLGGVLRVRKVFPRDVAEVTWVKDGYLFVESGAGARFIDGNVTGDVSTYRKTDFPELAWVRADSLAGEEEMNGKKCRVFVGSSQQVSAQAGEEADGAVVESPAPAVPSKAWIEIATGRPVAFLDESGLYVYEYGQAPASLTPPADFLARVEVFLKYQQEGRYRNPDEAPANPYSP